MKLTTLYQVVVTVVSCLFALYPAAQSQNDKIALGAIFDQNTEEIQNAFKYAMLQHNQNSGRKLEMQAFVDVINTADAFKLSRLICNQFARGVYSMLGAVTPDSFDTLHSYTNTFQMPFVTPWFPEKVIPPSSGSIDHAVSMRPDYHKAVVDTIIFYGWKNIIYIYDSHDGLLRLQQLYRSLQPGNVSFQLKYVKRISNSTEAISFLQALERLDRWGYKFVVLDCVTNLAKEVLVGHVRDVHLGRRTYHYLLSGLVMDDRWESEVTEYEAINVTGFRMVDFSRKIVRDFIEGWKKVHLKARDTISAHAALMYDGVQVLIDALTRLQKKKPDIFRNTGRRGSSAPNTSRGVDCNPGKSWVVPFEHGDKISRLIKKTELDGLTGEIRFNEEGHRYNFSFDVVEMRMNGAVIKIATWSDTKGLIPIHSRTKTWNSMKIDRNRTYIVTSILEEPYLTWKLMKQGKPFEGNERFHGFCKDFADLLTAKLGIKYELRLVKDGLYGYELAEPKGAWNGMIGEILRNEADMAIASLSITREREEVVQFSKPFLTLKPSSSYVTTVAQSGKVFTFLSPLSLEIWLCVVFSFFAVSVVLFIVSRFSPYEWKNLASIKQQHSPESSEGDSSGTPFTHEFSIWNSMWFSIGSFMQQGCDVTPRSLSGRIVSCVWWFFTFVLISSYTANLAAYLTVERMVAPNNIPDVAEGPHLNLYSRLWDYIGMEKKVVVHSNDEGTQSSIEGPHALSMDQAAVDSNEKCEQGKNIVPKNFGVVIPIGSPLKDHLDQAIQDLKDDGSINDLIQKWWLDRASCSIRQQLGFGSELTLSNVAGVFYLLLMGLCIALAVALLEFCYFSRVKGGRSKVPLSETILRTGGRRRDRELTNNNSPPPRRAQETATSERDQLGWNGSAYTGYYTSNTDAEGNVQTSFAQV